MQSNPKTIEKPRDEMTCYALRLYIYCDHEYPIDFAVSFDQELLKIHYTELDKNSPLVDISEHKAYADQEHTHWVIEPTVFLH
jgi:hypothetical protein